MPRQATITTALARMACGLALALAWGCAWAAGSWQTGATQVFRHARLPGDVFPIAMLQDRHGLIWLGTQSGLIKWDGHRLHRYVADASKAGSIQSSYITGLHEDAAGRLWVATDGGGLARFDPQTAGFTTIPAGAGGLSSPRVMSLASDGKGTVWVGTGNGLNRLVPGTGQVHRGPEDGIPKGLPPRRVASMLIDQRGDLWVGMLDGLYVLPTGAAAFQEVPLPGVERPEEDVCLLKEDGQGRLWIGTCATGVFVRDPASGTIRQVMDSERGGNTALEVDLRAIHDAGNGEVWLGTWGQGIVRVDTTSWSTTRIRHDPQAEASLSADFTSVLYRDRSGLMWAGGPGMMDMTDPSQRAVYTWYGGPKQLSGGASAQVASILARPDGSVWLGSGQGGVDIIPPDRGPVRRLVPREGRPRRALPPGSVLALANAPDGRVFIGTLKGLYVADEDGTRVELVEVPGMPGITTVRAMCVSANRLWISGSRGLRHLDLTARSPSSGPSSGPPSGEVRGLEDASIISLNCESQDQFWIGTPTGLLRFRPTTGAVDRPWPAGAAPSKLPAGRVTSTALDHQGRLWVALYGSGVCVAHPGAGAAPGPTRCIGDEQGSPVNAANALALDAQGDAWVSTDSGVVHIDRQTLRPTLLQQADGVGLLAHWSYSVATTGEGDILFGGHGLTILRPAGFRPWRYAAPLVLTDIDGEPTASQEIRLGPTVRSVQLGFALLDYSAPDRVRYAYRLKGLEQAWTSATAESRIARYTNVPPGDYTFEVRAQSRVGDWTTAQWPMRVEPTWYETRHARGAAAAAVLLLLWAMVRLRLRLHEGRASQLREQVAQRTHELQQRTEQLEASRQALRKLGAHNAGLLEEERKRVARELHDELGQQLAALRMEVSVMKARSDAGKPPDTEQWQLIRDRVDRLTGSMRALVADLRPPALDGGLSAALEWLAAEHARTAGTPCSVEVDPQERALAQEVKTMIFRVAQESLHNILRHAGATQARLELKRDEAGWDLRVSDDGAGFDATKPPRGFGLLSMEERAQLVGGTLRIYSRPGKGTCVHLHLPDDLPPTGQGTA